MSKQFNDLPSSLNEFETYLLVDKRLARRSVSDYCRIVKAFLVFAKNRNLSADLVREYLGYHISESPNTYSNRLKALRHFFAFVHDPHLMYSFAFPSIPYTPIDAPGKAQVSSFYSFLPDIRSKAIFLRLAISGLRLNEVMTLKMSDIDYERRMIKPNKDAHQSATTKKALLLFFNVEAEEVLIEYIAKRDDSNDDRIFQFSDTVFQEIMVKTSKKTSIHITAKSLRDFFSSELGELGVPDRYVDAFQGRTPKKILARHYTDFKPERLKSIYDKENLMIFKCGTSGY